jgi:eukaryotic-like serine/threonine-protein kinase
MPEGEDTVKIKTTLYPSLILLIGSLATVPQLVAQVPCGGTIMPKATLSVNWPQYLYDATHSGCNPYETILSASTVGNLTIKWRYGTEENNGVATAPVLVNGVVYIATLTDSLTGLLSAVDAGTGNLIWSYNLATSFTSSPSVANGIIYIGSGVGIHAISSAGTPVWYFNTNAAVAASPVIVNGVVYERAVDGTVYALNASTGAVIWQYATGGFFDIDSGSSPAVASGVVYVGPVGASDNNIYALDAATGALIWQYTTPDFIYSSPTVANGKVYFGCLDNNVYALDAKTGALVWKYSTGAQVFSSPAVARGVVYISSESNIFALNGSTGVLLWSPAMQFTGVSSAAVANNVVYVCGYETSDGSHLYALDASTGAVHLKSGPPCSNPIVANGVVYVADEFGVTALHLPGQ